MMNHLIKWTIRFAKCFKKTGGVCKNTANWWKIYFIQTQTLCDGTNGGGRCFCNSTTLSVEPWGGLLNQIAKVHMSRAFY